MIYSRESIKEEEGIKIFSLEDFYWYKDISLEQIKLLQDALDKEPIMQASRRAGVNSG